jgi:6-phosphofructokinase 1
MRIGILTGGGDVPGLNPAIKTVTYRGESEGHEVIGIRRGWMGLLHYNPDDPETRERFIQPLNKANTRTIDRTGGTFLHTSRTNPSRMRPEFLKPEEQEVNEEGFLDFTPHVLKNLEHLKIDVLIPIGGEDTLGYAARLHREGFLIVSIPKTMDNDVFGTDFCIGFSTAVTRSVRFIHQLRSTSGSHERIGVVELFGRHCGETWAIISEVPFDIEKLADLLMQDKRANPSNYAMMTISEGARMAGEEIVHKGEKVDAYGHKKLLQEITGEATLIQEVAYLMRSGEPDALDVMVAVNYANTAMDLIAQKKYGRMIALREGRYTDVTAESPLLGVKTVDVRGLYDVEEYRPKVWHAHGKPMFLY